MSHTSKHGPFFRRITLLAFALGAGLVITIGSTWITPETLSFQYLPGLLAVCESADHVEIFDGLPDPRLELAAFNRERTKTGIFTNHAAYFYERRPDLPAEHVSKLIFLAKRCHYSRHFGPRQTDSFHPAFLLRFHSGSQTVDVQLSCRGDNHAVFFGPEQQAYVDIEYHAAWQMGLHIFDGATPL